MIGLPASLSAQRVLVLKVAALKIVAKPEPFSPMDLENWPTGLAIAAVCAVVGLYVFKHLGYLP